MGNSITAVTHRRRMAQHRWSTALSDIQIQTMINELNVGGVTKQQVATRHGISLQKLNAALQRFQVGAHSGTSGGAGAIGAGRMTTATITGQDLLAWQLGQQMLLYHDVITITEWKHRIATSVVGNVMRLSSKVAA